MTSCQMFSKHNYMIFNILIVSEYHAIIVYLTSDCDYIAQVLKESFKIYCAINDGIINLVDKVMVVFTWKYLVYG